MIYTLDENYETTKGLTDHSMFYEFSIASAFDDRMSVITRDNYHPASLIK